MKLQTTSAPQLKTVGSREGNRAEPVEIWKARNFIHEHSDEELSLTRVAKAVNISSNHLSEKFKQVTGVNFVKYVACTRYEKARALLHDLDLRVSEIAFAAGFQSLSQFNRVFTKFSGMSPTAYRAGARAKGNDADECESYEINPGILPVKMRSQSSAILVSFAACGIRD